MLPYPESLSSEAIKAAALADAEPEPTVRYCGLRKGAGCAGFGGAREDADVWVGEDVPLEEP